MKKSNKNWFLLLLLIFTTVNTSSQVTEKCGTFSSDALEKRGLGCEDRSTYTTQEFTFQSSHFIIHYTLGEPPPDYEPPGDGTTHIFAETVSQAAEQAWNYQINQLGWQTPPYDGNCGGGNNKYDIYIKFLFFYGQTVGETPYGTYGYISYIEISPQIRIGENIYRPLTDNEIMVTIAHEFNHALQYRHNAVKPSNWFYENTSTWMEELNHPEINEWITFFMNDPDNDSPLNKPYLPIDKTGNEYEYNGALFCHTMSKWKGVDVIKDIWEYTANSNQEFLYDINAVLYSSQYDYISLKDVLKRYAVWRYFTGDYDDGNHFDKASLMQGLKPLRRHNNGIGSGDSTPENLNSRGGTNYIVFKHANGVISLIFDGQNYTQFAAIGLEKRLYFSDVENNFSLDGNNYGIINSLSCIGEDSVVLIPVVTEWQNQQNEITYNYSSTLGTDIYTSFWTEKENSNLNGNLSVQSSTIVNSGDSRHLRNQYQYKEKTNQERFPNFQGKPVKHNNWNLIYNDYLLSNDFLARIENNKQSGKYNFLEQAKVQILPEGYLLPGQGSGSFLDPWYVLSNGTQPGNYWVNFTYEYEPTGKEGATEKGVFLDQDYNIPGNPYYKVDMPLDEEIINVNGQNRKFFPYKWQNDGGASFKDEYERQTGVVFASTNAIAKGILKGQLMSNDENGVSNPSQRKMVRTDNGQYHVVYESMGTVFYTYSLTSDFYGAWSPDESLHYHGKNPAIDYEDNEVKIVFEYYDPQVGGNATIQLVTYGTSGGGTYEQIDYEEVTTYPNSYYGNAKPVISYSQYEIFVAYRIGPNGVINQKTKWWVSWPSPGWQWGTEAEIPGTNADCINPSVTGYYQTANVGYVFIAYENAGTIYFKQARRMPDVHANPYWDYQTYGEHPVNISALSGFNLNRYPVISLANENSVNQYLMISWQGIYNGTPTNPLPKIDGTKPIYRQAAVVKTGFGTSWGTTSSFNNNVDYTNNGSLNTAYGSIMMWSELNGQYSKYVRKRTLTGYDPITSLSNNYHGIHTLVSNGSEFGNIKAMVFDKSTNPYFLNRCTDDFTYIPNFGKITEDGLVDISYGRSGIVEKNEVEFVFNIGDVLLNGETIKFIERADTLPVTSLEELNSSVRTDTLTLNPQSELIFSDFYYVVNSESADSILSNDFNVHFKCELVKVSNGEVAGVFEEVDYNKNNLEEYGYEGYLIDCSGIETGDYYLRLSTSVNEEVGLSLSDIQVDNVVLEKSNLNIRNFKGSSIPLEYSLEQNYPNPFNPATTIRYQIPKDGMVTLKVYDILGAEVMSLVNEELVAGKYEVSFNASRLASGVYIYRLNVNDYVNVKKMVLLK